MKIFEEPNKELSLVRAKLTSISFIGNLTIEFSEKIIERNISWFNESNIELEIRPSSNNYTQDNFNFTW